MRRTEAKYQGRQARATEFASRLGISEQDLRVAIYDRASEFAYSFYQDRIAPVALADEEFFFWFLLQWLRQDKKSEEMIKDEAVERALLGQDFSLDEVRSIYWKFHKLDALLNAGSEEKPKRVEPYISIYKRALLCQERRK